MPSDGPGAGFHRQLAIVRHWAGQAPVLALIGAFFWVSSAQAAYTPPPSRQPRPGSLGWVPVAECIVMGATLVLTIGIGLWFNSRERRRARATDEEPVLDTPIDEEEAPWSSSARSE
jgi:hypothetical protein